MMILQKLHKKEIVHLSYIVQIAENLNNRPRNAYVTWKLVCHVMTSEGRMDTSTKLENLKM